jgi:excisionase family DNA binding protein
MKTAVKPISKRTTTRQSVSAESDLPGRAGTASNPCLLTLGEAAQHLGHVHRTTIMRWVREGRLKCIRLSRKAILFEPTELDRFVREHRYSG